ncbi:Ahk1p NDAI_0D04310 [Naumovozyma dairenensis CBS 421]|uniref:Uncharacterized protein n=1 Tax=Naumovozyma dairenensis (strain ATCC 10597 / BCRC 20456 / CBS 421 / NBRC 0211 / NRRL Y-12639) TaxID=1071378 RepID=G0WAD4_NAUDC|nr:hypothetical protein NDAI_0D04310 [Naumovozyma dairenensis CBS 421]CCD24745.1 hypothetical protein NDAI_0D04310 [Naumovozyma dairenensis CBS 421]
MSINDEQRLFQSLNEFLAVLDRKPSNTKQCAKCLKETIRILKMDLLSLLRHQLHQHVLPSNSIYNKTQGRDILIQWWVSLLNYLNYNNNDNGNIFQFIEQQEQEQQRDITVDDQGNKTLENLCLSLLSIIFECISKIITLLMILPSHSQREYDVYCHHILLTIENISNILISNSRHRSLQFYQKYNSLLAPFLGKLNAFGLIYLPDDQYFDVHLLLTFYPIEHLTIKQLNKTTSSKTSIFAWKERNFKLQNSENSNDLKSKKTLIDRQKINHCLLVKNFKIIQSYLKNDQIFMSFYWHYWYIIICTLSSSQFKVMDLNQIPTSKIILKYATSGLLKADITNLNSFITKNTLIPKFNKNSLNNNELINDTMPDVNINDINGTKKVNKNILSPSQINDHIFKYFKSIKLWECLESLVVLFSKRTHGDSDNNNDDETLQYCKKLIKTHDSFTLKFMSRISAYDYNTGNIIFNKLFQFIIYKFHKYDHNLTFVSSFNWSKWLDGMIAMLKTNNLNSQIVTIICLFNIWSLLPSRIQMHFATELIELNQSLIFDTLLIESFSNVIPILLWKFIIFKMIPSITKEEDFTDTIRKSIFLKINEIYNELVSIQNYLNNLQNEKSKVKYFNRVNLSIEDNLLFYDNKKLIIKREWPFLSSIVSSNNTISNNNAKKNENKKQKQKKNDKDLSFPTLTSIFTKSPTLIQTGGSYPYDVIEQRTDGFQHSSDDDSSDNDGDDHVDTTYDVEFDLKSTFNSWFSKLVTTTTPEEEDDENDDEVRNEYGDENAYNANIIDAPELTYMDSLMEKIKYDPTKVLSSTNGNNKVFNVFHMVNFANESFKYHKRLNQYNRIWRSKAREEKQLPKLPNSVDGMDKDIPVAIKDSISTEIKGNTVNEYNDKDSFDIKLPYPDLSLLGIDSIIPVETNDMVIDEKSNTSKNMDTRIMKLITRQNKLVKFINIFNLTMEEYYDFLNLVNSDHTNVFLEFEIIKPSGI